MLVHAAIHVGGYAHTVGRELLPDMCHGGRQDACQAELVLNCAILIEGRPRNVMVDAEMVDADKGSERLQVWSTAQARSILRMGLGMQDSSLGGWRPGRIWMILK